MAAQVRRLGESVQPMEAPLPSREERAERPAGLLRDPEVQVPRTGALLPRMGERRRLRAEAPPRTLLRLRR
jgi:hypothetical protein